MDTLIKILVGGAVVFLVFGGPRLLKKKEGQPPPIVIGEPDSRSAGGETSPGTPVADVSRTFVNGQPINQIRSLEWLRANGNWVVEMQEANLTYYLLAKSTRCHIDSVADCLKQAVLANGIDPTEFQYTYFLDRVLIAGSGVLFWDGKTYFVSYDHLRNAGWRGGNNYNCRGFRFQRKGVLEFLRENITNEAVFTPTEKAPYPNGATASGQGAIDWMTVSVNPRDFPLSVPDARRRAQLEARFTQEGKRPPAVRCFVVIETRDGRLFLTEAMDTGGGVKQGWIDWRIGNSSAEIKYFFSLGRMAKAYGFTFEDPEVTLQTVLENSGMLSRK